VSGLLGVLSSSLENNEGEKIDVLKLPITLLTGF
jgi:hypothetical protein